MADNVTLTTTNPAGFPNGTTLATREHAGGHASQVVPLYVSGATVHELSAVNAAAAPNASIMVGGEDSNGDARQLRTSTAGRAEVDVNGMPVLAATVDSGGTEVVGDTVGLYADPATSVSGATTSMTGTADTSIIAAQGAGIRTYLTTIVVANEHASVGTLVAIKDGTTIKMYVPAASGFGGGVITLPKPLRGTANTAWQAACITTGAAVRVSAVGYTSEV